MDHIIKHPDDRRIAIVTDLEDLVTLWQQRAKHDIHGILCHYPVDPETLEAAAQTIEAASINSARFSRMQYAGNYRRGVEAMVDTYRGGDGYLQSNLRFIGVEGQAADILIKLSNIFARAQNVGLGQITEYIRVNDDSVTGTHRHAPFLGISFRRAGLRWATGEQHNTGKELQTRTGQVGIFDDTVWHGSPVFDESAEGWNDRARVSAVIIEEHAGPTEVIVEHGGYV